MLMSYDKYCHLKWGGCSTKIIAGLSVMFYRQHKFINMMPIILKGGLNINSCYILVYFPTDKNPKKSLFLYTVRWMCRTSLHCRYFIWFTAIGGYVIIWACLVICLRLQPMNAYRYCFCSVNVTRSNIWKCTCCSIKMWGISWLTDNQLASQEGHCSLE